MKPPGQGPKRPDWTGRTVVCIASGPSLTQDDCLLVLESGHPVIVTNTTFRLAPWADVLFGFDARWWKQHIDEVRTVFKGRLMSPSQDVGKLGVEMLHSTTPWFRRYGNSGACAVAVAVGGGAKRIVMLGYDCGPSKEPGKVWHWHGDHPNKMSNCASVKNWPYQFKMLADWCGKEKVQVVNASRATTLTCFERADLGAAL